MTTMDDLIRWLRVQLDEDSDSEPHGIGCELTVTLGYHGPCDCGMADRWPAEVEAKQHLLNEYEIARARAGRNELAQDPVLPVLVAWLEQQVRHVGLVYAGCEGYREEWRPQ